MKIAGIDPSTLPNIETLVIPRGDQVIVFKARGLPDMDAFDAQCPAPIAPAKVTKDGKMSDLKDVNYLKCLEEHNKRRLAYIVIKSIEPSEIEWDTVKMDEPNTWINWQTDMKNAGLNQVECNLIFQLAWEANQLDDAKLKKAREAFLRGPQPE